jgi:catechol 2,3-dioxygenase-like lactoylglutathione lyase family enzyme
MPRIQHIALSVPDPDKAARFYETAFNLKRVGETPPLRHPTNFYAKLRFFAILRA